MSVPNDPLYLEGPPVVAGSGGPVLASGTCALHPAPCSRRSTSSPRGMWRATGRPLWSHRSIRACGPIIPIS
jgi:hypothetical protein